MPSLGVCRKSCVFTDLRANRQELRRKMMKPVRKGRREGRKMGVGQGRSRTCPGGVSGLPGPAKDRAVGCLGLSQSKAVGAWPELCLLRRGRAGTLESERRVSPARQAEQPSGAQRTSFLLGKIAELFGNRSTWRETHRTQEACQSEVQEVNPEC